MFAFVLLTGAVLLLPRPASPPRGCTSLSAVEADTTISMYTTEPSPLLHARSTVGPRYPIALRDQRVPGDVRATFVVDTLGRVIRGSSGILEESDRAFGQSVCDFLRVAEFEPIVVAGKRLTVRVVGVRFLFRTNGG